MVDMTLSQNHPLPIHGLQRTAGPLHHILGSRGLSYLVCSHLLVLGAHSLCSHMSGSLSGVPPFCSRVLLLIAFFFSVDLRLELVPGQREALCPWSQNLSKTGGVGDMAWQTRQ